MKIFRNRTVIGVLCILLALIICFGLMQVELVVLLMLIAAFLFVEGVAIYQMVKLEKKL